MIKVGIDTGVEYTKAAAITEDGKIFTACKANAFDSADKVANEVIDILLSKMNRSLNDIGAYLKTGMSRKELSIAGPDVSDAICLGSGVAMLYPDARFIMDAGVRKFTVVHMEDSKIVKVAAMDKCASGAGACLNTVSAFLHLSLQELNEMYFQAKENIELETKCAVFVESEIISRIHKKTPVEEIVHGVFTGLARRCQSPLVDVNAKNELLLVGGISKLSAFVDAMHKVSGLEIKTVNAYDAQTIIAIGAAFLSDQIGG